VRTQVQRLALLLVLACVASPAAAAAQWMRPPYYPAPAWRYAAPESNLRINVKPKDASVYVDGFFAGKVDEFDGRLQRLHVAPGQHEIVVYLEGYRPLRERLYLSANSTRTIEGDLERLAPGEAQEPQPQPAEPERAAPPDEGYRNSPPPAPGPRGPRNRRMPPDQPTTQRAPRTDPGQPSSRFAALSIRIEPEAATVTIDGERWDGPSGDERLIVQVPEGHHVIEVEREGYDRFTTELDVRAGETRPVNVSLRRR
jgi:hypothetical protein